MKKPLQCYYKTLNVSTKATQKEIKESYYSLAKKLHPDSQLKEDSTNFPEHQQEHFKLVTEAYQVLGNEERRKEYDQTIYGVSHSLFFQCNTTSAFRLNSLKRNTSFMTLR